MLNFEKDKNTVLLSRLPPPPLPLSGQGPLYKGVVKYCQNTFSETQTITKLFPDCKSSVYDRYRGWMISDKVLAVSQRLNK